jgi:hypothetical protein
VTIGRSTSAHAPPRWGRAHKCGELPRCSTWSMSRGRETGRIQIVPYACWYCSVVHVACSTRSTRISQMWSRPRWITNRNSVLLTVIRSSSGLQMEDWSGTGLTSSTSSGRVRPTRSTAGPRLQVHRETSTQLMTTCGRRVTSFQNCSLDFGLSRIQTGTSLPGPSWPTLHICGEIVLTANTERNSGRLRTSGPTRCNQGRC